MYPIEKYRYYVNGNKVIAVSTYAGKTVRGVAICDEEDEFDLEKGKRLAAARCAVKIATKRLKRAEHKVKEADEEIAKARAYSTNMAVYLCDAEDALDEACEVLEDLLMED